MLGFLLWLLLLTFSLFIICHLHLTGKKNISIMKIYRLEYLLPTYIIFTELVLREKKEMYLEYLLVFTNY
jgi:hypothetical protein